MKCSEGHSNATAFVSSTKVQIFRSDRRDFDRHGGIVLGFNPHLESSTLSDLSGGVELATKMIPKFKLSFSA